jgi:hypothetical protein
VAGGLALSSCAGGKIFSSDSAEMFSLEAPFDGGILHERCGPPVLGVGKDPDGRKFLRIRVSGKAPAECPVSIECPCGTVITAERKGNAFSAEVKLKEKISTIKASAVIGGNKETVSTRALWVANTYKRFRFQIDDNSFFLRDIHQKNYRDIFECFYLDGLRKLHERYGALIVLNCFYSTPEKDFDLSMMSDKYKKQWNDNADWLRLAFHSFNEFPNEPYLDAPPEQLAADFDLVNEHLARFAGDALTPPAIIHWGMVRPDAYQVFADRGVKTLIGGFNEKYPRIDYRLPENVSRYLVDNFAWYHFDTGIVFQEGARYCGNNVKLEDTYATLNGIMTHPNKSEVLNLITHEQYTWPYYKNYIPDHLERLEAALRIAVEHGYKPCWFHDDFCEGSR